MTWFSLSKFFVFLIACCGILSCQSAFQKEYKKAQKSIHLEKWDLAKVHLLRSLKKTKKPLEKYRVYMELAELFHFKIRNYKEAIYFYQKSVIHSQKEEDTILPNERQAFIYANSLKHHDKAITKYHQLINISNLSKNKKVYYHIQLAQLYYNVNKFFQAELEANRILSQTQDISSQHGFKVHLLLGNIFFSRRETSKAIDKYKMILRSYPQQSLEHKIYHNLSLSYEEEKSFGKALSLLKEFLPKAKKEDKAYMKTRIQSLQKRRLNSPGFRIKSKAQL